MASPAELKRRLDSSNPPIVLDVRSKSEFIQGHVPGAIHIPFWKLTGRERELPGKREHPVVVYCGHGPRAWYAAAVLRARGFTNVSYLDGHMARWRRERLPEQR